MMIKSLKVNELNMYLLGNGIDRIRLQPRLPRQIVLYALHSFHEELLENIFLVFVDKQSDGLEWTIIMIIIDDHFIMYHMIDII